MVHCRARRMVYAVSVLAVRLNRVHSPVSLLKKLFVGFAVIRVYGNAHATGHAYRLSLKLEVISHRFYDISRHLVRVGNGIQISHVHKELIAADTADHVAALKHFFQNFRSLPKELIAVGMAQKIICLFEVIQIDNHQRA